MHNERCTSGSEGGPEKPIGRKADRALRSDPTSLSLSTCTDPIGAAACTAVETIPGPVGRIGKQSAQPAPAGGGDRDRSGFGASASERRYERRARPEGVAQPFCPIARPTPHHATSRTGLR